MKDNLHKKAAFNDRLFAQLNLSEHFQGGIGRKMIPRQVPDKCLGRKINDASISPLCSNISKRGKKTSGLEIVPMLISMPL